MTSGSPIEAAHAFLRAHTTADLRFDEHMRPIKYVIAPDGRLVAPVMVAMLETADTVLFVPDCREGAMEVQVTLSPFDETGPHGGLTDRWRIHHGTPEDIRWAFLDLDGARHEGIVVDGEAMQRPNPLAADESALCKHFNQGSRDDLRAVCLQHARINIEEPVVVAVDPTGFDVRGTFDVVHVAANEPMPTADDARRVMAAMIEQARAGA